MGAIVPSVSLSLTPKRRARVPPDSGNMTLMSLMGIALQTARNVREFVVEYVSMEAIPVATRHSESSSHWSLDSMRRQKTLGSSGTQLTAPEQIDYWLNEANVMTGTCVSDYETNELEQQMWEEEQFATHSCLFRNLEL